MLSKQNISLGLAVVAIVIAALVYAGSSAAPSFSGVSNVDELDATAIKIGGSSGSRVGPIITGTCTLRSGDFAVIATTSVAADCPVTGVVSGDIVFAQFATTTTISGAGWLIEQASASSTSGFITLKILNLTGTTAAIPGSIASTTQYLIFHPVSSVPGL